jgi:signal transduction histidine kinase
MEHADLTSSLTPRASDDRQRLARDVHDSVIQPYLGLRIGLTTVQQNLSQAIAPPTGTYEALSASVRHMLDRIEQLIALTDLGIADLRRYIDELKSTQPVEHTILPSIEYFATVFAQALGLSLEISIAPELQVNERLLGEVFQIVVEGLSNVRRHSHSQHAWIRLTKEPSHLILRIENERDENVGTEIFTPRSITERAQLLRGQVVIEQIARRTVVVVTLPI